MNKTELAEIKPYKLLDFCKKFRCQSILHPRLKPCLEEFCPAYSMHQYLKANNQIFEEGSALARQHMDLLEVVEAAKEVFKQIDLRTRTLGLDMSNYHAISIQIKPGEAGKDYWQAVWAYNKALAKLEALAEGGGE